MDSNRSTSQFNIAPFQRVEINIGPNIDRSQGELLAQLEGYGAYVERADYPCLLTFVNQASQLQACLVARDGEKLNMGFSGLVLTHPTMNVPMTLTLIIYKVPCNTFENDASAPIVRLLPPFRIITNNAAQQVLGIFVPPGMRIIRNLQVQLGGGTGPVGTGVLSFTDINGNFITGPTNLTALQAGVVVTYNAGNNGLPQAIPAAVPGAGNGLLYNFGPVQVPVSAIELRFTGAGLTFTGSDSVSGQWE